MNVRSPRLVPALVIAAGAIASALLLWSCRDYVPMWDGREYAECIIRATRHLHTPAAYRCAGHISQSYVALLAFAQRFASGSPVPMLAMNALLLALGAVALHRITRRAFPDEAHRVGASLIVAAFLVHPIVLGSAVQPGLDFGVLVFSLCALAAALEERRWAVVLFGTALVFSKEPGVLVYGVIAALYLWTYALARLLPNGLRWLGIAAATAGALASALHHDIISAILFALLLVALSWRGPSIARVPAGAIARAALAQWPLAIPLVLVFGYMGVNAMAASTTTTGAAPVVWGNTGSGKLVQTVLRTGIADRSTLAVLALMLVVGFLWIPSALTLVDLGVGTVRARRRLAPRPMPGVDTTALGLVVAALVGEIWFLSRFITFSNARYYLPVYPLALVVAYAALVRLGVSRAFRTGVFATLAVLLGASAVRTIDPVSRLVWGTFQVGEHPMLQITSLTNECCGAGRDQLVYNLEFTRFAQLTDDALSQLRAADTTLVVVPVLGDWYTVGRLDVASNRRTLSRHGVVEPFVLNAWQATLPQLQVPSGWYFELPYLENGMSLARLSESYDISTPAWVSRDGYAMAVRRLRLRRATPPLAPQHHAARAP